MVAQSRRFQPRPALLGEFFRKNLSIAAVFDLPELQESLPDQRAKRGATVKSYDNQGRLVGEITTIFTGDGKVITTNTVYNAANGQPIAQNISIRDSQGRVTMQNIIGGKLLP